MKNLHTLLLLMSCCYLGAQSIHRVACNGNVKKLDSLLKTADIDTLDNNGRTLILYATGCRREKAFDLLMSRNPDVNIADKNGLLPITFAARFQNQKFIDSLIAHGVDVNARDSHGNTMMHLAVIRANLKQTKQFINDKTDLNAVNKRGSTVLEIALRERYDSIAEFLIAKGADRKKVRKFKLKGRYLGQEEPGLTPKMFAPNVVSVENSVHTGVFHVNENEFYYSISLMKENVEAIMVTKKKRGRWTPPKRLEIFGDTKEFDSFITHDGTKLFYCSNRKVRKTDTIDNADLWMMKRVKDSWGKPIHLGNEVNSQKNDWFPSVSNKGTLVFSPSDGRNSSIVYSLQKNGVYQKPIAFGETINEEKSYNYDPLIAPDESYIIFSSRRKGNFGGSDLYISFKKEDGTWSKAKNMGETINSDTADYAPSLSPDGKYLFFTSNIEGSSDIYWISSKVIENLKKGS